MAFTKINAAGIGTTETVTVDGLTVINDGSFGGNLTVSGVLTYEDVTNVDSVGLITARNGIVVGSGITLSKDGDGFFTGIVTATSFSGSGANLTGIDTDLVSDTTPQLGGDLDTNDNAIRCSDSNGTNNQITFGDSNDLQIRHQSNSSYIINSTGNLNIGSNNEVRIKGGSDVAEMMIKCVDNGTVELYHDGTKKFETISTGVVITGSDDGDGGAKGDFKFFQTDGTLKIMFDASTSQFEFLDNSKASFGNDDDLKIYHDSNNSAINHNGTGDFYIQSNNNIYIRNIGGDNYISAIEDGAVELYHNGTKKFETASTGTTFAAGTHVFNGPSGTSYALEVRPFNSNPYAFAVIENSGANAGYPLLAVTNNSGATYFRTLSGGNTESRTILPVTDDTYDLGSTSKRWANIYTNDLQLSNEAKKDKGGNDVDGTWGDYTIQEGESDLFLINNRSGKKYKFNLTEVS